MQTAVVWSCFPFIRSGQNHLARHIERGKKTRRTKDEVGRQHQGMDRPGVRQVPEGGGELGKMEKTGCKIICGAPTTLAVKGLMMMMMTTLLYTTLYLLLCTTLYSSALHYSILHCTAVHCVHHTALHYLILHLCYIALHNNELCYALRTHCLKPVCTALQCGLTQLLLLLWKIVKHEPIFHH